MLALLVFPASAAEKPNVLVIVVDDLGFADVGFNGVTIPTPNLDRLAATGVNLTGFRAAPICSPTRVRLMTGRWPPPLAQGFTSFCDHSKAAEGLDRRGPTGGNSEMKFPPPSIALRPCRRTCWKSAAN